MSFNDSMIYTVPSSETHWLFKTESLHNLVALCSSDKRPRITTRRARKKELPTTPSVVDLGRKTRLVSFPREK
ncbi:MAG: hypothetical protein AAF434_12335 [Pseudomonadota bacterium]